MAFLIRHADKAAFRGCMAWSIQDAFEQAQREFGVAIGDWEPIPLDSSEDALRFVFAIGLC